MSELSSVFLDHFRDPRNVGELLDATGRARHENPVCGDILRLTLRVEGGRIAAVRFLCEGCSGSIAAASRMSQLATGLTLAEARALDARAIERELGGLPALKRHGADLAAETLVKALQDHEARIAGRDPGKEATT